jgi:signal transduction histidine kinase
MLARRRPQAVAQLIVGMGGAVFYATVVADTVPGDPLLGLMVMAIAATVLVQRWLLFVCAAAATLAASSWMWDPLGTPASERILNAFVTVAAYVVVSWLLLWLREGNSDARRQLEALITSKDEFVATVSHELRTPLTAIVGLAHELEERFDEFSRAELDEFISLLAVESNDVANIVEDLLVAARADIGTLALRCQPLEVRGELAITLSNISNVAIDLSALEDATMVYADALRLRQIVRNLIVNANRYGGEGVRVAVKACDRAVLIEVRDDGEPIPLLDRELIFEPYYRSTRAGGMPGSAGLGLTVSRRLARLMGGDVSYGHDGRESVFTVRLPIAEDHALLATASA